MLQDHARALGKLCDRASIVGASPSNDRWIHSKTLDDQLIFLRCECALPPTDIVVAQSNGEIGTPEDAVVAGSDGDQTVTHDRMEAPRPHAHSSWPFGERARLQSWLDCLRSQRQASGGELARGELEGWEYQ